MTTQKPIVLILCTGNSARSQMAEALLRKHRGNEFEVHSAGTEPKDVVHPLAIRAMAEVGIDIARARPKDLTNYLGHLPVRHLIIVCDRANESCPRVWPGAFTRTYLPFEDPARATGTESERLEVFRRVRDELSDAMATWKPAMERLHEGEGR
jgi:arsenate reductase